MGMHDKKLWNLSYKKTILNHSISDLYIFPAATKFFYERVFKQKITSRSRITTTENTWMNSTLQNHSSFFSTYFILEIPQLIKCFFDPTTIWKSNYISIATAYSWVRIKHIADIL